MDEYVYLSLEDVLTYYGDTIEQSGGGCLVFERKEE